MYKHVYVSSYYSFFRCNMHLHVAINCVYGAQTGATKGSNKPLETLMYIITSI